MHDMQRIFIVLISGYIAIFTLELLFCRRDRSSHTQNSNENKVHITFDWGYLIAIVPIIITTVAIFGSGSYKKSENIEIFIVVLLSSILVLKSMTKRDTISSNALTFFAGLAVIPTYYFRESDIVTVVPIGIVLSMFCFFYMYLTDTKKRLKGL